MVEPLIPGRTGSDAALTQLEQRIQDELRKTDRRGKVRMFVQVVLLIAVFIYLSFASQMVKKLDPGLVLDFGKNFLNQRLPELLGTLGERMTGDVDQIMNDLKVSLREEVVPKAMAGLKDEVNTLVQQQGRQLVSVLSQDEELQAELRAISGNAALSDQAKIEQAINLLAERSLIRFQAVIAEYREQQYVKAVRDLNENLTLLAEGRDLNRRQQLAREVISLFRLWVQRNSYVSPQDERAIRSLDPEDQELQP